jgi:hypothetical protein
VVVALGDCCGSGCYGITVTVHSIYLTRLRIVPPSHLSLSAGLHASRASRDLRVKSNFSNRIKLFLPVQSLPKKYSGFPKPQITLYLPPSTPVEGRIAIVTDAGLDAVAESGASDESALLADGKIVWS